MHRRAFVSAMLLTAATSAAGPAKAATLTPYTRKALDIAQETGKPILIFVHAGWCPTCAKQSPIIESLMRQPEFANLVVLKVDFDTQKEVLKAFSVTQQSTLIAMHGTAERGRSVGETGKDAILALMLKATA